jgi:hypothetical protein
MTGVVEIADSIKHMAQILHDLEPSLMQLATFLAFTIGLWNFLRRL